MTTTQTTEDTKATKRKAKPTATKAKSRGATTRTAFSEWCAANSIEDTVAARRALRAANYRAPYDPTDEEVARIAKDSQ